MQSLLYRFTVSATFARYNLTAASATRELPEPNRTIQSYASHVRGQCNPRSEAITSFARASPHKSICFVSALDDPAIATHCVSERSHIA